MARTNGRNNGDCCMCGEKAVAFWMCDYPLYICKNCALDKLSLLIGEAGVTSGVNRQEMMAMLDRVMLGFWRGAAIELATPKNTETDESFQDDTP